MDGPGVALTLLEYEKDAEQGTALKVVQPPAFSESAPHVAHSQCVHTKPNLGIGVGLLGRPGLPCLLAAASPLPCCVAFRGWLKAAIH